MDSEKIVTLLEKAGVQKQLYSWIPAFVREMTKAGFGDFLRVHTEKRLIFRFFLFSFLFFQWIQSSPLDGRHPTRQIKGIGDALLHPAKPGLRKNALPSRRSAAAFSLWATHPDARPEFPRGY